MQPQPQWPLPQVRRRRLQQGQHSWVMCAALVPPVVRTSGVLEERWHFCLQSLSWVACPLVQVLGYNRLLRYSQRLSRTCKGTGWGSVRTWRSNLPRQYTANRNLHPLPRVPHT